MKTMNTVKKLAAAFAALVIVGTAAAETVNAFESTNVYRAPTGKKYHVSQKCAGANGFSVSLDDALTAGLEPCGKCCKKQITRIEYDEAGEALDIATLVTEIPEAETWLHDEAVKVVYTAKDGTQTEITR